MTATTGRLEIEAINKSFGPLHILKDVSLNVRAGEFITLLGPSGSGKTTTLRIVAGFLAADRGRVVLDDVDLTHVPPHKRDIGMVFQNYALFPHLTVARNIAFPLEMRGLPRAEIKRKVQDALDLVQLGAFGERKPQQLSGGQQQRVALARALVFEPRLLLMDEPLGALDRQLRESMQIEIMKICREVGHTALYVTHDQEEALAMSDRIALFNGGRIEQIGTPEEIYRKPASLFAATFIGESTTFIGEIRQGMLAANSLVLPIADKALRQAALGNGDRAALVLRPDMLRIRPAGPAGITPGTASVRGRVESQVYLGTTRKYVVKVLDGPTALVRKPADAADGLVAPSGQEVELSWDIEKAAVVPLELPEANAREHDRASAATQIDLRTRARA
ncbi:ABC transporter ATP-binding protein [Rhodoligotrophos defluvii]|uniref:ABC transporter ATP-binding protein n=1 Tax=Rhodoligotrophos defluvii TaxID=2561934 RepID=UPI0010C949F3|nr:ABC transporter ATP-binding protein [Rhodoligotrophos defluvii]